MKYCPKCDTNQRQDTVFCPYCSDLLVIQPKCGCGEPIWAHHRFCPHCGNPINEVKNEFKTK